MDITDDEITGLVGLSAFRKGRDYVRRDRVRALSRDGDTLTATVRGSGRNLYATTVELRRSNTGRAIAIGTCSCPVGRNCKHVAAVLLAARPMVHAAADTAPPADAGAIALVKPPTPSARAAVAAGQAAPVAGLGISSASRSSDTVSGALPPHIVDWLARLDEEERGDDYPPDVAQRLLYVIEPHALGGEAPRLALRPTSVRLLKTGAFSDNASTFEPTTILNKQPAKFLRRSDIAILRAIALARLSGMGRTRLDEPDGAPILADILKTGRARWQSPNGPVLSEAPARSGRVTWAANADGAMSPRLVLDDADASVLVLVAAPPVYVVPEAGVIGAIETGLSPRTARALFDAPRFTPEQTVAVARVMRQKGGRIAAIAPTAPAETVEVRERPIPVLDLFRAEILEMPSGSRGWYGGFSVATPIGAARLSFRYGPAQVEPHTPGDRLAWIDGARLLDIHRDLKAERRIARSLQDAGLRAIAPRQSGAKLAHALRFADEVDWFAFLYEDAPDLRAEGWDIRVAPDFPYQMLRGDSAIEVEIREGSGIDWFELDLGITLDGERLDLVPPLLDLLAKSDPSDLAELLRTPDMVLHLTLPDGRYLSFAGARLLPFLETLIHLFAGAETTGGRARYAALDAAQLDRLEDLEDVVWRGGERVRALGRKLAVTGRIPDVAVPSGFTATLRPYQARGLAWLDFLRDAGLGGILADDMGLGKTLQALALIAAEREAGRLISPALVIAPTSLMANWQREASRFTPDLKVLVLQGHDRHDKVADIDGADIVLSTYPLVARDTAILMAREWHILLLDEAQAIKNPNAATTRQVGALKARHRFCLTGTPVENNLAELWSLFQFIAPGFLGDAKRFARDWRTPIEKKGDTARAHLLAARVKPFLLRRTKDAVAIDLPPKTEMIEAIGFGAAQQAVYDTIRLAMHERVRQAMAERGLARSRIILLDALLKLRQTCCDPRLLKGVKGAEKAGSAKLDRLMEMLSELVAEGRKVLVFSQFTAMLALIQPRLAEAGISWSLLTGDTVDRAGAVAAFQDGPASVFLVSLKAGGVGLNLTAADTVILYDPWWNPAVEAQAIDRAHRIGQDKPVFVFKLTAIGTIEEKIEVLKARKAALAASLFDPDGPGTLDITEADIDLLFGA